MIRAVDFSTFDLPSVLLEESAAAELHAHGSVAAAVLVPMTRWPERPTLTFTERNADLRKHAGEISFPGGMSDPGDSSLEESALREAEEEVSLSRDDVQVIGLAHPDELAPDLRVERDDAVARRRLRRLPLGRLRRGLIPRSRPRTPHPAPRRRCYGRGG